MVEAVGGDVTSVAPGDFVVLNWRAVCGECRSCRRGRPWYCFTTHNATQTDDAGRRHPAHRRPWGSGPLPRRRWWPPASAPRWTRPARPEAAGLLGCGVMAGLGAAMFTGEVGTGRLGGRVRLRGGGLRRHRSAPVLAGARPIIAVDLDPRKARAGARQFGATACRSTPRVSDPVEAHPGADRRQRRRRLHRGGRPTRRSWSRPSTPATWPAPWCRWGAHAGHAHRPADDRRSSAAAGGSSRAGTATACRRGTSPC